ncbi:MAG: AMP-binding protein [Pseudomonadota bacterium]
MQRVWAALYPPGTRADVNEAPFQTIGEMTAAAAQSYGDKTAFTTILPNGFSGSLTFKDVHHLSDAFAAYLRKELKLKSGDRVALQVPNTLVYPIAAFGILKAGCVLVNVNPLYTGPEMAKQLGDAKPQALIIINMFADKLTRALVDYAVPHIVLSEAADFFPSRARFIARFVQRFIKRQIPHCPVAATDFSAAIAKGEAHLQKGTDVAAYAKDIDAHALALLQYTGGTTGVAKGAMLSHRNILMNMAQSLEMVGIDIAKGEEVILSVLPLYHIFAFTINFLGFFWLGAENVLIPNPRPLTNLRKAFSMRKITWLTGVNTLFNGLTNSKWFVKNPPRHLKRVIAGGMALQTAVAERWRDVTGVGVIEGYGLTETSPVVTFNPFDRPVAGSIGLPIPSTDIRCVDDQEKEVAGGEVGELCVKGPQVMQGYWQKPDETVKVLKDGWLHTGDMATVDAQGYVRIVDRKKDMILHSGFNIYPNEVEDCLARHPQIIEAAVIGVPDGASGEAVKAFIVRRDESLTVQKVRDFCKENLTAYKVPKFVEFRDSLPKSNVGKILRKDLR